MNWNAEPFHVWFGEQLEQIAAQAHLNAWEKRAVSAETEAKQVGWMYRKALNRVQSQQEKLQKRGVSWRDIRRLKQLAGIDASELEP